MKNQEGVTTLPDIPEQVKFQGVFLRYSETRCSLGAPNMKTVVVDLVSVMIDEIGL